VLAAALDGQSRPGPVGEDVSHGQRRHRQEVRPVVPLRAGLIHQLEVGFVDQGGGVQGGPLAPNGQVAVGDLP
jgi:hypothetical protein